MIQVCKKISSESRGERLHTVNLAFCPRCKQKKKLLQAGTDKNTCKIRKKEDPSCHPVIFWDLSKSWSVFGTFVLVHIKQTREGCRGFQSWKLEALIDFCSFLKLIQSLTPTFFPSLRFPCIYLFFFFFIFSFHDYLSEKGFDLASQDFLLQHCRESMSKKPSKIDD